MIVLLHAHSDWSHDGSLTITDWVKLLGDLEINAVCLTEHEESGWDKKKYKDYKELCENNSKNGTIIIPGIEFNQEGFHILCYGLKEMPERPSSIAQLSEDVAKQGCFLVLAHPCKYDWKIPHSFMEYVLGAEVWNSKFIYEGILGPSFKSLKYKKNYFVGQDVHKNKHLSTLFVKTQSRNIIADLKNNNFDVVFNNKVYSFSLKHILPKIVDIRHHFIKLILFLKKRIKI